MITPVIPDAGERRNYEQRAACSALLEEPVAHPIFPQTPDNCYNRNQFIVPNRRVLNLYF
jgi:hypothetical protein